MTKKIFMLLAAVLLSSANLFAQSNEPLKGDVNEDGMVDVADINAIIGIILKSQNDSETTYYWYVGQTDPSTMSSIDPVVNDNSSSGWREIGTTLPNYSSSNKLWDGSRIETGDSKTTNYVALPNSTLFMYDAAGNISSAAWTAVGTKEIEGVTYYIYSSVANLKSFTFNIY